MKIETMKKRSQFLAAQSGIKKHAAGFTLLALERNDGSDDINVGFTCSKKVGNAVERNTAKRRLREAARAVFNTDGEPGWDYVLIGKPKVTSEMSFSDVVDDLRGLVTGLRARSTPEL